MTSSNGNIFHVTGPLCGGFTGHQWIPHAKASDTELWCFLWSVHEQIVVHTIKTPVIWDSDALIMASQQWIKTNSFSLRTHCSMGTCYRYCLSYRRVYLTPGINNLTKLGRMENLMSFPTKSTQSYYNMIYCFVWKFQSITWCSRLHCII